MTTTFSQRLKEARERLNLKQKDVQERIGINNRTLSGYETGKTEPDNATLLALSNLYNVSVDWLMGRVDFSGLQDIQLKEKPSPIELSSQSLELHINGKLLTEEERRKLATIALILFGDS